jgi:Virulence protein RhuM family
MPTGKIAASSFGEGTKGISGEMPTVAEAHVAKNFYGPGEIDALNLVTSMTLEFFESQAEQRRPTTFEQFLRKMRELLKLDGRPLIRENIRGSVSMADAKKKASTEIKAYKERIRIEREIEGEKGVASDRGKDQTTTCMIHTRGRRAHQPRTGSRVQCGRRCDRSLRGQALAVGQGPECAGRQGLGSF